MRVLSLAALLGGLRRRGMIMAIIAGQSEDEPSASGHRGEDREASNEAVKNEAHSQAGERGEDQKQDLELTGAGDKSDQCAPRDCMSW
jgi:hypothetical protein